MGRRILSASFGRIIMELTQKDFDERHQRVQAGTGDDEDRRLVKHYLGEGFTPSDGEGSAEPVRAQADAPARQAGAAGDGDGGDDGPKARRTTGRASNAKG
jgi:hypothetical protein